MMKMNIEKLNAIQHEIINELITAINTLEGSGGLLPILGSWGDTLPEVEILAMLKEWNSRGR